MVEPQGPQARPAPPSKLFDRQLQPSTILREKYDIISYWRLVPHGFYAFSRIGWC